MVKVFKNGVYISSLSDSLKGKSFAILKNIDTGSYQFIYPNFYEKEVQTSIYISENRSYEINICVNKLGDMGEEFRGLIDSITPTSSLIIKVQTSGCFATSKSELKISLKNDKYFATYKNELRNSSKVPKKTHKSKFIYQSEIELIRYFEYELGMIEYYNTNSSIKMMCTSTSLYELRLNNIQKQVFNSDCSWRGFWQIIDKIF